MALDVNAIKLSLEASITALTQEIQYEQARRTALAAAGNPAVTTYSVGGKSVPWNDWLRAKTEALKELIAQYEAFDVPEVTQRMWT